jgi:hypothetical protein
MKNFVRSATNRFLLVSMLFAAFFMASSPLLSAPVFADPLSPEELKAVNQYPNWVADACSGSVAAPVAGGLIPDDQIPGRDNREKIWNYLISLGLSPVEAAGIEGNIGREGVYDPTNIEDPAGRTKDWDVFLTLTGQDQGYGLIGFTPGISLAKSGTLGADWSGISGVDVNKDNFYYISTQLSVVYGYMKNSKSPSGNNMLQEYKNKSTNPGNAALAFEDLVENPGVLASDERVQFANDAMRDFGGHAAAGVPSAPAGTTGSSCGCPSGNPSAAGGGSVSPNLTGSTAAEQAFNYFTGQGLPAQAAAGLVGNFMTESGGNTENLDTHAHNDISGTHDGIAQWSTSRWDDLKSHERGDPYDLANQLDFVWYELNHDYRSVLDGIKHASSASGAATIVNSDYEVSGDTSGNREANAQGILAKYGGNTPGAVAGGGCGGSVDNSACGVSAPVNGSVHGSGDEYSQEELARIFGDPGTASSHPVMDQNLKTVDFLGNQVQINKKASACLEAVAAQIKSEGIHYTIREMGCYRYDSDNGSSNIGLSSYHTYGVACDINWDTNPWSGNGAELPHDMPEAYIKAFHDHGFTWGGDWVSVKDYMHFEFNGIKP